MPMVPLGSRDLQVSNREPIIEEIRGLEWLNYAGVP